MGESNSEHLKPALAAIFWLSKFTMASLNMTPDFVVFGRLFIVDDHCLPSVILIEFDTQSVSKNFYAYEVTSVARFFVKITAPHRLPCTHKKLLRPIVCRIVPGLGCGVPIRGAGPGEWVLKRDSTPLGESK